MKSLTAFEKYVIQEQGTEPAWSGEYLYCKEEGTFTCRQCDAALFDASSKFQSTCGWLSFDLALERAIRYLTDPDGQRVEIRCQQCDGHLGHVFEGEGFTALNQRYCVNSVSLRFQLQDKTQQALVVLGGGCFWCLDAAASYLEGIISVHVGYAGGSQETADYRSVCSKDTGHAEVVQIEFNQAKLSYQNLLHFFFKIHDPTTLNRQGYDVGPQYRSVIFTTTEQQICDAREVIASIEKSKKYADPIVTEVLPLEVFYPGEVEHKGYFVRYPAAAYCKNVIQPKINHIKNNDLSDF